MPPPPHTAIRVPPQSSDDSAIAFPTPNVGLNSNDAPVRLQHIDVPIRATPQRTAPVIAAMDRIGFSWADAKLISGLGQVAQPSRTAAARTMGDETSYADSIKPTATHPSLPHAQAANSQPANQRAVDPPPAQPDSPNSLPPALLSPDSLTVTRQQPPSNAYPTIEEISAVGPSLPASTTAAQNEFEKPIKLVLTAREGLAAHTDELGLRIAARSARGDSRFTIRLDPPELGHIEVNLSMTSRGHAQAALAADKPQTLELLQRDAAALERTLKDAGLDLGSSNLSFSLKGEGRTPFGWHDQSHAPNRTLQVAPADTVEPHFVSRTARLDALYGPMAARIDITV